MAGLRDCPTLSLDHTDPAVPPSSGQGSLSNHSGLDPSMVGRNGLINKATFQQRFEEDVGVGHEVSGGRVFQAEGTASTKHACRNPARARGLTLGCNEQGSEENCGR